MLEPLKAIHVSFFNCAGTILFIEKLEPLAVPAYARTHGSLHQNAGPRLLEPIQVPAS